MWMFTDAAPASVLGLGVFLCVHVMTVIQVQEVVVLHKHLSTSGSASHTQHRRADGFVRLLKLLEM